MRALVAKARAAAPLEPLRPLARSALALGCAPTQRKHLAVIARLNEFGFFRAGGVLVGTHAFLSYANQLGLRWSGSDQTRPPMSISRTPVAISRSPCPPVSGPCRIRP